ncbi:hypothetical protein [Longimicrobium sp.]|uniref:hypothetical protein n=1 Tax=Longimicrobium sp. TaxID=2029185 RepID=UPI002C18A188|nr:hypothetical protein [Longimicrobium sp.]HSU14009.1 hypothetical protein [Longimicrobium sp.]
MRRIAQRRPLSENPREFVLAALLFTTGAVLLAGFGVTTLAGSAYSDSDLRGADFAYQAIGWGKYVAGLTLLWLGDRATLHRGYIGWKRVALLWMPLVLFIFYSYLQWMVIGDARIHYLQRTDHWGGGFSGSVLFMAFVYPVAIAVAAVNALWIQRRQLRVAL